MSKVQVTYEMMDLIDQHGIAAAVEVTISALKDYADEVSDAGLKERAIKAMIAAEKLIEVAKSIDDF